MKNLANCSPREFFVQTNKIRKAVEKWLSLTQVLEIRKRFPSVDKNATPEEKRKAFEEQINENIRDMLGACLEEHPNETAEILGLCCFVEPEDLDNHEMSEFLGAIGEIISNKDVIGFFMSLVSLGQTGISEARKA